MKKEEFRAKIVLLLYFIVFFLYFFALLNPLVSDNQTFN